MAVGLPRSKADIDERAGMLAVGLRDNFTAIKRLAELLALGDQAYFVSLGYTVEEYNLLKNAYLDLYKLAQIWEGTQAQTPAYNFRTNAQLLMGVI